MQGFKNSGCHLVRFATQSEIKHEVAGCQVDWGTWHVKHDRDIVGLLCYEGIRIEGYIRPGVCFGPILEIYRTLKVCLRDVVVVEEAEGSGRYREQNERGDEKQDCCQICLDCSWRDQ